MTTTTITTTVAVQSIPSIGHREAMTLAECETRRFLEVVRQLAPADGLRPTDCQLWDVKDLVCHVLGAMEAYSSVREFVRQMWLATKASRASGRPSIDEMTDRQVREHAHLSPDELALRLRQTAPRSIRGRRSLPGMLRAMPFRPGAPFEGTWTLGFLVDIILNRDTWMHRIDLARATGSELAVTPEHDGRIVADVVADWARMHRMPVDLTLDGPAGGRFVQGAYGEELHLDAVEFCRIVSGRAPHQSSGLLSHQVPF